MKKTLEEPVYSSSGKRQEDRMTLCDIAGDREQWRELVALASMAESSWTINT